MSDIYYFDNNATTKVAPEVIEAMLPFFEELWGNPSSAYGFGSQIARHLDVARGRVAEMINADPKEVTFTSCGTESNNSALESALATQPTKRHIVTTAVEHSAILKHCQALARRGCDVTYLPVNSDGLLDLKELESAIRPDTAVVSLMLANNETGVLFPVKEAADICRKAGVLFHTDATQVPGKVKIDVRDLGVDMLTLSAHKLHAPKGIGMLYIKRRTRFHPYIIGGHQERGRRSGTENVPGIVAFGRAAELAMANLDDENTRIRALRDRLEETILSTIPGTFRVGSKELRLPNTANICFENVEAEAVLMLLDQLGICASSGSACTTGSLDPSHVLTAMGLKPAQSRGCLRFSLGIYNTAEDVTFLLDHLPAIITKLRALSPTHPYHRPVRRSASRASVLGLRRPCGAHTPSSRQHRRPDFPHSPLFSFLRSGEFQSNLCARRV